jgi:glycosyltransferase involved in cell wall biosynthesis
MVSVIIPTYNRESFLSRAIQSVLSQTYSNWELLVVDDGSTDNTRKVVNEYIKKDNRIKYFYKENGGQGSARNLGIKHASGEYIAFLDSDDEWLPEKLELQIDLLEKNDDADFSFCDANFIIDEFVRSVVSLRPKTNDLFMEILTAQNGLLPSTLVVRRSVIESIGGFNEEEMYRYIEDIDFAVRLSYKRKFIYLNKSLVLYWTTKDKMIEGESDFKRIGRFASCLEEKTNIYREIFSDNCHLSLQYRFLGSAFVKSGNLKKGQVYLLKSLKLKKNLKTLFFLIVSFFGVQLYQFFYLYKIKKQINSIKSSNSFYSL